jgi:hypothetical protein
MKKMWNVVKYSVYERRVNIIFLGGKLVLGKKLSLGILFLKSRKIFGYPNQTA